MSKYGDPTQGLRFAALTRVSTEKQERRGESLATQRAGIERDVARMGGSVVEWYSGQEHATPGWEREQLDRLLADAARGRFDAVIVAYLDRWSRDNAQNKEGLNVFRRHGVRFYVSTMEMNLYDPQHRFVLGMNSEVGEMMAMQQSKKSLESRINRASRGWPAVGELPYGRTFDRKTERWNIDPAKQALVQEAARRYLAGEKVQVIASLVGMNATQLHRTLMHCCGGEWRQSFNSDKLNIRGTFYTPVPALLDDDTIRAIQERAGANRTYAHGRLRKGGRAFRAYLLGRVIFCGDCGLALSGQAVRDKFLYYRTSAGCHCRGRTSWVPASLIEAAVIEDLFQLFGNAERVRRAVEAATPDPEQVGEARAGLERVSKRLAEVAARKARLVRAIANGTINECDAAGMMAELKQCETTLLEEKESLGVVLQNLPSPEQVEEEARRASDSFKSANRDLAGMTYDEKRALIEMVFAGKTADGRRLGVYVRPGRAREWGYRVLGRLVEAGGVTPRPPVEESPYDPKMWGSGADYQGELLEGVRNSRRLRPARRRTARRPGPAARVAALGRP
jgi:DNA invertase Pin-like site-specific DNA recombinase